MPGQGRPTPRCARPPPTPLRRSASVADDPTDAAEPAGFTPGYSSYAVARRRGSSPAADGADAAASVQLQLRPLLDAGPLLTGIWTRCASPGLVTTYESVTLTPWVSKTRVVVPDFHLTAINAPMANVLTLSTTKGRHRSLERTQGKKSKKGKAGRRRPTKSGHRQGAVQAVPGCGRNSSDAGVGEDHRGPCRRDLRGPRRRGKGGTIKRVSAVPQPIAHRIALPAPTDREKGRVPAHVPHRRPAAGEIVRRSGTTAPRFEHVAGLLLRRGRQRFLRQPPIFERMLVEDGFLPQVLVLSVPTRSRRLASVPPDRPDAALEAVAHGPESITRWEDYRGRRMRCSSHRRGAGAVVRRGDATTAPGWINTISRTCCPTVPFTRSSR